jgi:hypothetical protein
MPSLKSQNFNLLKPKSCQISALRGITKISNMNRKKQPNRNFNIPAQRTQIGKYKSNTYDYLKLNKTIMKVISKLWKMVSKNTTRRNQIPKQLRFCKNLDKYKTGQIVKNSKSDFLPLFTLFIKKRKEVMLECSKFKVQHGFLLWLLTLNLGLGGAV